MPGIPDIFGVKSRYWVQAYVARKIESTPNPPPPPPTHTHPVVCFIRGSRNFSQGTRLGPGQSDKKALTTFFFFLSPQLILRQSNGQFQSNLSFFKVLEEAQHFPGGGGSNFFQGGGGVQLLISYRNPYNLWFSREVRTPAPLPPLDPHLHLTECRFILILSVS